MPLLPWINPPPGKSGPGTSSIKESKSICGLSIIAHVASISSFKLCGGILVVIPTAIPVEPFINKFGRAAGKTEGSVMLSL